MALFWSSRMAVEHVLLCENAESLHRRVTVKRGVRRNRCNEEHIPGWLRGRLAEAEAGAK